MFGGFLEEDLYDNVFSRNFFGVWSQIYDGNDSGWLMRNSGELK